jgi:electron transfer flavoprotein alpha subunit
LHDDAQVSFVSRVQAELEGPNIEEAEIIVAGGRGLETEENFKLMEELARVLGGCVGVTRPLVDAGWAPHYLQIGQSGKTVKPKLIITCGISGSVQFSVGMQKADCIVAIDKDPDAPIFSIANYGIVGKTEDILPTLIKTFRT